MLTDPPNVNITQRHSNLSMPPIMQNLSTPNQIPSPNPLHSLKPIFSHLNLQKPLPQNIPLKEILRTTQQLQPQIQKRLFQLPMQLLHPLVIIQPLPVLLLHVHLFFHLLQLNLHRNPFTLYQRLSLLENFPNRQLQYLSINRFVLLHQLLLKHLVLLFTTQEFHALFQPLRLFAELFPKLCSNCGNLSARIFLLALSAITSKNLVQPLLDKLVGFNAFFY